MVEDGQEGGREMQSIGATRRPGPPAGRGLSGALALLVLTIPLSAQQTVDVTLSDETLGTVSGSFWGLHYDGPEHQTSDSISGGLITMPGAYGSPACRELLHNLGIVLVRIFVWQAGVHPDAETWNWETTDEEVRQVVEAGFEPLLCLHQTGPTWMGGTEEAPWWETDVGREQWAAFAGTLARRYGERCRFYEILNEPNIIHGERRDCFGWDGVAEVYLRAAAAIREARPEAACGGAATWAAWETAQFGKTVLARPGGEELLDFVSFHIYASHDLDDPNDALMARTPWFSETPRYIREQLAAVTDKPIAIACTEYNSSAVCARDGKPYTDPRNVNAFGGVLAADVLCRSALGGADMVFHFATIGGFGLIVWPPEYRPRACYHAHLLLAAVAGLQPGALVLGTSNSLPETEVPGAVEGKWTHRALESYGLQARDGSRCVVLVCKGAQTSYTARVSRSAPSAGVAEVYQYSSRRIPDALYPLSVADTSGAPVEVQCPPYSVTVVKWPVG